MDTLTNQEFFYRNVPVNYDGTGTVTKILGNHIHYNQLVQNGNFSSTDNWTPASGTFAVANNVGTLTLTANTNAPRIGQTDIRLVTGHKYYIRFTITLNYTSSILAQMGGVTNQNFYSGTIQANTKTQVANIATSNYDNTHMRIYVNRSTTGAVGSTAKFENVMLFDLTLMGIDSFTTTSEVEEWLSSHIGDSSYFSYSKGKLIFFLGSGLKTQGGSESNTMSLPNTTYFINGMRSIPDYANGGFIHDEITPSKSIQKIRRFNLGGQTWARVTSTGYFRTARDALSYAITTNALIERYTRYTSSSNMPDKSFYIGSGYIYINDTDYTDASSLRTSLAGVYLVAEQETYIETNISPELDMTYPIWANGTEQILPTNGSTPTTTRIICDIDYRGMTSVETEDDPDGSGTTTGDGDYRYHDSATVTATSTDLDAYRFEHWEDENGNVLSTDSSYTFTIED